MMRKITGVPYLNFNEGAFSSSSESDFMQQAGSLPRQSLIFLFLNHFFSLKSCVSRVCKNTSRDYEGNKPVGNTKMRCLEQQSPRQAPGWTSFKAAPVWSFSKAAPAPHTPQGGQSLGSPWVDLLQGTRPLPLPTPPPTSSGQHYPVLFSLPVLESVSWTDECSTLELQPQLLFRFLFGDKVSPSCLGRS